MVLALGTTAMPAGARLKKGPVAVRAMQLDRPGPAAQQGLGGLEHAE